MIVADASWVIALLDPLDPHHARAVELHSSAGDELVTLHPLTFAECLVGAARAGRLDDVAAALRAAFEVTTIDDDAPLRWAELRATTPLRLPDAVVLDTAVTTRAHAILTFDERLTAQATRLGIATDIDAPPAPT